MNKSLIVSLFALSIFSASLPSEASETDTLLVRAKAGPSFYSNVNPVTSTFGVGLDLGFRNVNGLGLAGAARLNFLGSGQDEVNSNTTVRTEVKSLFLGIIPSYAVSKGIATLSFGLGLGVLSLTTQTDTFVTLPTSSTSSTPETTKSRFAIAPTFEMDFAIASGLFANVGAQYIVGLGDSPKPGIISPMVGIGYNF